MPKLSNVKKVLVLGAGPIVIGQACEFDYSGTQACLTLKEEGCFVILVNPNPATIMTDQNIANVTYIEPIKSEVIEKIISKEKPDVILPTMGGQTALNCALELVEKGILAKYTVGIIGVTIDAIHKAEDRKLFKECVSRIGLKTPKSFLVNSLQEAVNILETLSFPIIVRASFALGGRGSGIAYNEQEFVTLCKNALSICDKQVLIEESLIGWKEFELEVIRDCVDNCIVVCSIENFHPMGVHTGDSITVAPAQTLTDKEFQKMRQASFDLIREIGITTGGCNVQFAVNPKNGDMIVIEVNPRVSRSSALASKATGFPIAKIATKLALGYSLAELSNTITQNATPASFEPCLDYVVVKIPCFDFKKFTGASTQLNTQMQSVGEVMAIGRCFQEALQKALRSLDVGVNGFDSQIDDKDQVKNKLTKIDADLIWAVGDAFRLGLSIDEVNHLTAIDPWFLYQIFDLIEEEKFIEQSGKGIFNKEILFRLKQKGFSDERIAFLLKTSGDKIRKLRLELNVRPVYKRIDTCACEFPTETAYLYSTYDDECEANPSPNVKKVILLGSGANRIGQGIEFDYCCVHAALAIKESGFESIIINCNPETVSTDFEICDRLYFEPLTLEDVLNIIDIEQPKGVFIQYGGQTSLKLAVPLESAGVNLLGVSASSIDITENRFHFKNFLESLNINQPFNITFITKEEVLSLADKINYPIILRPSYVLGGKAISTIRNLDELKEYLDTNSFNGLPILLEEFIDGGTEVEIDAIFDGKNTQCCGVMQQLEPAGIHSGDSSCVIPPIDISQEIQNILEIQVDRILQNLKIIGLVNFQFIVKDEKTYLIEVNPRSSRTVPYVSKSIGCSIVKLATKIILEGSDLSAYDYPASGLYCVKVPIFSFSRFAGVKQNLSAEMRSTGEVMGVGKTFAEALHKGLLAGGNDCVTEYYDYKKILENYQIPLQVYSLQDFFNGK